MGTLVSSFLDGATSFLQVTRTTINAKLSMNISKIPSPTTELAALGHLKTNVKYEYTSAFICDWIVFILAGNKDGYTILEGLRLGKVCGTSYH